MTIEIDMSIALADDKETLGVFLHVDDTEQRIQLQSFLFHAGAQFVSYPVGNLPPQLDGQVTVADSDVSVTVGRLCIVGTLDLSAHGLAAAKRATLFVLDKPFDIKDKSEKTLIAATVLLEKLEKDEI